MDLLYLLLGAVTIPHGSITTGGLITASGVTCTNDGNIGGLLLSKVTEGAAWPSIQNADISGSNKWALAQK